MIPTRSFLFFHSTEKKKKTAVHWLTIIGPLKIFLLYLIETNELKTKQTLANKDNKVDNNKNQSPKWIKLFFF